MARLIYPSDPNGLLVDVLVGLSGLATSTRIAAGRSITPPLPARGLIDAGTDVTAVNASLLQKLKVSASYQRTTHTISGQVSAQMFVVSLGITDLGDPAAPELVEADLTVMELVNALPQTIEVLIGLDVLRGCKFQLDGPAGWFSLEFLRARRQMRLRPAACRAIQR
jgi:hypothetical protein